MDGRRAGVERLIRKDLLSVEGYAAPASLEELQARFGARLVKIDQNENPYGCSPRVREALARYDGYHAYPDVLSREVCALLSEYTGAPAERIVIGNGSDEILEITLRLLIEPGDQVINCPPTFGYYQFAAGVAGAATSTVQRRPDFGPDVAAIRAACDDRTKIIFLASPNNPTGNLAKEGD
ncbi:MAG: aminotransferase class I/II-fold pyridoxal phosphate-dependent enzyme, partial [Chloroflexi bacterium]|nr:aminotransferase class I/II-fold pyridoxal phosphate-dependent enzyme [Chloroflexota bacterium]